MSGMADQTGVKKGSAMRGLIIQRLLQIVFITLLWATALLVSAGRPDWTDAWALLAVYVSIIFANGIVIMAKVPDLAAERARVRKNAKSWDKVLALVISLVGPLLFLIIAGLDERFGWSPEIGLPVKVAALLFVAAGYGFMGWAMASNRFFSGLVAIQRDRGHMVVSSGPYSLVRHPGYLGMSIAYLATPLALGSAWALIPAALTVGVLALRTSMEDRTLQEELPGYREYEGRVRYRLLPGVW